MTPVHNALTHADKRGYTDSDSMDQKETPIPPLKRRMNFFVDATQTLRK